MSDQVTALEQQSTSLTTDALALVVTDHASYESAGEFLRAIATYIRRVGDVLDPIVEANHRAHKVAVAQRDALLKPAMGAKRVLGDRMAAWDQTQAEQRRAAEQVAQRERQRLERAAYEQAEGEQRRLQAEAEDRRLAEAAAMEARGDGAAAVRLLDAPLPVPTVAPAPVFVPAPVPPAPPKAEGVSYREVYEFEVVDAALVPREYWMIDEKKIGGVVRALRAATHIPGVRAFSRRIAAVRA